MPLKSEQPSPLQVQITQAERDYLAAVGGPYQLTRRFIMRLALAKLMAAHPAGTGHFDPAGQWQETIR